MIFVYLILYLILDSYCKSKGWDDKSKYEQEDEVYGLATVISDQNAFYNTLKKQHHAEE